MYKVILLSFLCSAVNSHCGNGDKPCSWKGHHHHFGHHPSNKFSHIGNYFQHLANKLIHSDESYNNHCDAVSNNVQEMYTDDAYILIYSPGFAANEITLQVKHRVLNTIIKGNGKEFYDTRIVPDILNAAGAGWYIDGQKVKVVIPYRIRFNVITPAACIDINKETITIQNSPDLANMNVYRSGQGSFGGQFNPKRQ